MKPAAERRATSASHLMSSGPRPTHPEPRRPGKQAPRRTGGAPLPVIACASNAAPLGAVLIDELDAWIALVTPPGQPSRAYHRRVALKARAAALETARELVEQVPVVDVPKPKPGGKTT